MPALLHTSTRMAAKKVALTRQNYTEDDRGLVSASLQFVAKASDRSAVDGMFYTDALPPVWPTSLDRGRLIGRNLFMQSRTLSEQYGLLTIDALFVGGRERISPVVTSEFESPIKVYVQSEPYEITRQTASGTHTYAGITDSWGYTYTPKVVNLSFVRVGTIDSFSPVKPKAEDMFTLNAFDSHLHRWNSGELAYFSYPEGWFLGLLNNNPVIEDRKTESLTPTVRIITVRYSFGS